MADPSVTSALGNQLRLEIERSGGVISLERYMRLALYAPEVGYYERSAQTVGKRGDFYTSVSVGPVFGHLLAFQFSRWLADLPQTSWHLVEAGAHDGRLAADILGWFRAHRADLASRIRLWLVEPSPSRQAWQRKSLAEFGDQVHFVSDLANLRSTTGGFRGIIYSNELLDAFPVHRLQWDAASQSWQEVGVTWDGARFRWQLMPQPLSAAEAEIRRMNQLPRELLEVLPDGFKTEFGAAARNWWREAAETLRGGWLMTVDYGLTSDEFLAPHRTEGTLRGYVHHRPVADLLAEPGGNDLTAQVDFSALKEAGESAGLRTEIFTTQRAWLTEIFEQTIQPDSKFPAWDSSTVRQFQTLTHPEHLGRAFRVLVQRR